MKRVFLSLLVIIICLDAFGAFVIDGLRYTVTSEEDHEVQVLAVDYYISGDIAIPAEVTDNSVTYSVTSISSYGFLNCQNLTEVTIPESVKEIGSNAFFGCTGLSTVTIPGSVKEIGQFAFSECTGLTSVTILGPLKKIAGYAFSECTSLYSVELPNTVEEIEYKAFFDCSALTSFVLPDSLKLIGDLAFCGCTGPTSLVIPGSVSEIGYRAFFHCSGISEISVDEDNPYYCSIDGLQYNKDATTLLLCPAARPGEVIIPETVVEIGDGAFGWCEELTSIILPSSLTTLQTCAFGGCKSLTSIVLPPALTYMGDYTFDGCSSLTSILIPASVTKIGDKVFQNCTSLDEINVEEGNRIYSSADGVLLNRDLSVVILCPVGRRDDFVIPSSVISIRSRAFSDCSLLNSVIIPNSVRYINDYAFYGCCGLSSIVIPNSVVDIGFCAFRDCSGLRSVSIPSSITSLSSHVFSECSSLTEVVIPNSVKTIWNGSFRGCSSLTSIRIPAYVSAISDNPFIGCSSLTEISVDERNPYFYSIEGVLFKKEKNQLMSFPGGKGGEYFIPNGVEVIGSSAFSLCAKLTSLHIPASVVSIAKAFYGCDGLVDIYCEGERPPRGYFDNYFFDEDDYINITLYVPETAESKYRSTIPWRWFENIMTFKPNGITDVTEDVNTSLPFEIYDLNGRYAGNDTKFLSPGLYIMRQGSIVKKIAVN